MRIVSVINHKGGVGKTTTAMNVSHALALAGHKVLLIDADPQSHLTTGLGVTAATDGLDSVLLDGARLAGVANEIRPNLFLVPAGPRLGEVDFMLEGGSQRGFLLRQALKTPGKRFDHVFIDCPPSSGLLGMNVLLAARELLVPVASDYLSLRGFRRLMMIVNHVEKTLHRRTKKWLAVTRYQQRRTMAREVAEQLQDEYEGHVLPTFVRESVALAESPVFGKTIFDHRRLSRGAQDYLALAHDYLEAEAA